MIAELAGPVPRMGFDETGLAPVTTPVGNSDRDIDNAPVNEGPDTDDCAFVDVEIAEPVPGIGFDETGFSLAEAEYVVSSAVVVALGWLDGDDEDPAPRPEVPSNIEMDVDACCEAVDEGAFSVEEELDKTFTVVDEVELWVEVVTFWI